MSDAPSEQRNATTAAISAGSAERCIGDRTHVAASRAGPGLMDPWSASLLAASDVATMPGQTQLALMFSAAYSAAIARVSWSTAPFDAS